MNFLSISFPLLLAISDSIAQQLEPSLVHIIPRGAYNGLESDDITPTAQVVGRRSLLEESAESFLGIQYASVSERFSPSQVLPPLPLTEADNSKVVMNATNYGPNCYQPSFGPPPPVPTPPQSEDCLFLNVWRPRYSQSSIESPLLPVMVWIHGGGFVTGSGAELLYDGSNLAAAGEVIVVTFNYRLGVFGLLTDPETGMGGMNSIGDQIEALKWVQQNIVAFGGDPEQVTIFGESIGGVSVCLLSVSPEAKGLFQRAIVQSGQCLTERLTPLSMEEASSRTQRLLDSTNLTSVEDLKTKLTAEELLKAAGMGFTNAALDSSIMPRPPLELYQEGPLNPTDMIIGSNTVDDPSVLGFPPFAYVQRGLQFESYLQETFGAEAAVDILEAYSPEKYYGGNNVSAYAHFQGEFLIRCGGRDMAAYAARAAVGDVYLYVFAQYTANDIGNGIINAARITDARETGWASHTAEIPFVFGNLNYTYLGPAFAPATEAEVALSRDQMIPRWVGFVKTGVPGEDWVPVPDNLFNGNESTERLRMSSQHTPSLLISAANTTMQKFVNKHLQCDTITLYGSKKSSTNPPTSASVIPPTSATTNPPNSAPQDPSSGVNHDWKLAKGATVVAIMNGILKLLVTFS